MHARRSIRSFPAAKNRSRSTTRRVLRFVLSTSSYNLSISNFLILQSRNLETALTFRESCDLHLSALNVLSRIDNVSLFLPFSYAQLYHLKQLCSLEQTLSSSWLPSGGQLTLEELLPMVQRMLTDMTLGELEKLRLLLITLFSYPFLLGTQQWSALVLSAKIQSVDFTRALTTAEFAESLGFDVDTLLERCDRTCTPCLIDNGLPTIAMQNIP